MITEDPRAGTPQILRDHGVRRPGWAPTLTATRRAGSRSLRWLEATGDPKLVAWIKAQDELTESFLAAAPGHEAIRVTAPCSLTRPPAWARTGLPGTSGTSGPGPTPVTCRVVQVLRGGLAEERTRAHRDGAHLRDIPLTGLASVAKATSRFRPSRAARTVM